MNRALGILGLAALAVAGCNDGPITDPPPPASLDEQLRANLRNWGVIPIGPMPAQDSARVALGQALLFDPILSGNRDIACATCHHPSTHLADGLSLSIGTGGTGLGPTRTLGAGRQFIPRSAPTLLNQGLRAYQVFWDGRVSGFGAGPFDTPAQGALPPVPDIVAAQAMFPVLNRQEMRGEVGDLDRFGNPNELAGFADTEYAAIWGAVMQRLVAIPRYAGMFAAAFPGISPAGLRFEHAATAIAAFQMEAFTRTNSPFDRYLANDNAALSLEAKRGALLFFTTAQCASCHSGPLLGGNSFANVGAPQLGPGVGIGAPLDLGRGSLPNQQFYEFAFRIPPLRNVELTAPYFHDGAYPTLEAVVKHYDNVSVALRGYDVVQLAPALQSTYHGEAATVDTVLATLAFQLRTPLNLTDPEMQDIVAFLKSLTDPAARDLSALVPASVPSGLPVP